MADHLTEEEQIEALKNWWNKYWKSIVLPIGAVAILYTGWNFWEQQKQDTAESGSVKYDALVKVMETSPGAALTDGQRAEAKLLADALASDFAGTLYADHANLILARLSVDLDDLDAAVAYLQRVVNSGSNAAIKDLATARLARVKIAQNDPQTAVSIMAVAPGDSAYKSLFAEVRGDAHAASGEAELAKTAYEEAIESLSPSEFSRRNLIQIKSDGVDILAGKVSVEPKDAAPMEEQPVSEDGAQNSIENPNSAEQQASAGNS